MEHSSLCVSTFVRYMAYLNIDYSQYYILLILKKHRKYVINLHVLVAITVWYITMEPFAGSLASLLILSIFLKSSQLVASGAMIYGLPIWQVALAIHVVAWIIQFIGHGVFEGKFLAFTHKGQRSEHKWQKLAITDGILLSILNV